jgi:ATPase subunit of ABC transporter with duplicated ATPase domains
MDKEADAARKHMRKELEWMRKQPKARTTKSKSRIEDFYETKEKASYKRDDAKVEIKMKMERLGSKILEVQQLSKKYDNLIICNDFTYIFKPGERIGIIGKNGVGKTATIVDTLVFAFFGKTLRKLNQDKIINSINATALIDYQLVINLLRVKSYYFFIQNL